MLDGSTALHWAAYGGNIEIIAELLAHNANPNIRNAERLTPYEMAAKYGHGAAATLIEKAMIAGNA
ncbi:MAG: ankyrin repeat domain-containing protein [Candidatus Puniceispirillaceae bacterium]